MRIAFVAKRSDFNRVKDMKPDVYVLLEPVDIDGNVILPEELSDEYLVVDYAPFGILDSNLKGSLDIRFLVFERRPKYVIFHKPYDPGYVRIDDIMFINASLGAVLDVDKDKVYVPTYRRPRRILYRLYPETPWGIPKDLLSEPARRRAYRNYTEPHKKRVAMFARSYMENRVFYRRPMDSTLLEELLSLEKPVFFDLEFDARALKRNYEPTGPIVRVASYHDGKLHRYFIKSVEDEKKFLEDLCRHEYLIGYGTASDEKILRKACSRYGLDVPKIIDLRSFIFPRDPKKQRIALPVGRKTGLKTVAESMGFKRTSDKDGYRAYIAYLNAKRMNRPSKLVRLLVRYNAEDTIMTKFVFNRIRRYARRLA